MLCGRAAEGKPLGERDRRGHHAAQLAEHVEFFSESSLEATREYISGRHFSVKMFASWTPTFYINLGAPYEIMVSGKHYLIDSGQDILILRNAIVERFNTPADNIFTVKFYPGSLEAVLGIKQHKLTNQVIDLREILPVKLLQRIKQPIAFNERIELMENYLLKNLKKQQDYYLKFVNDTIDTFIASGLQISNNDLAEKMFTTSKTINRYFNQVIGISPKNYFGIMRARTALTAYVNLPDDFIPYDFGYYDMSHFYKDVVKFTGQKLGAHKL